MALPPIRILIPMLAGRGSNGCGFFKSGKPSSQRTILELGSKRTTLSRMLERTIYVLSWVLAYLAPWASADGGTRKFPIKDIQYWRDYVVQLVGRYHRDIKYWEVWNEFNGSFADSGTPKIYAELVREASISAKAVDPSAKIGLSVSQFRRPFSGCGHQRRVPRDTSTMFCVHPYEKLGALENDWRDRFPWQ